MTDKVLPMLSMAQKAGRLASGETAVLNAIKSFKACLVLIAEDASDGTKKKFIDKSSHYGVPCRVYGTREAISHAIGKELRSVISVNDEGFADNIIGRLEEADINGE